MAKLSKSERAEVERNLAVCRSACKTFEQILADDDRESEKAVKAADRGTIAGIIERDGTTAGVLAIREMGRPGGPPRE